MLRIGFPRNSAPAAAAMRKLLKIAGLIALVALIAAVGIAAYVYWQFHRQVFADYEGDTPSILRYAGEAPPAGPAAGAEPLELNSFDAARFRDPGSRFGPWTRWWWPGADVEPDELRREIAMLAQRGFAGVEIQPFTMGLDLENAAPAELEAVYSYDTEAFFENLRAVMEAARQAGIQVDLNAGGGWPAGGPQIPPEDNFKTLAYAETTVSGGGEVAWELPGPDPAFSYYAVNLMGYFIFNQVLLHFYENQAELVEVVAAKLIEDDRAWLPWTIDDQVVVDGESAVLVGDKVEDNVLRWEAPEGEWRLIAVYSMPNGDPPTLVPKSDPGHVVDHFSARKVAANYNYLFGERSGLAAYYGAPFRAVFNDSYEFKVERHFADGFLDEFRERRGYDVRPWLPAVLSPGHDNFFFSLALGEGKPAFQLSGQDQRVNYDYSRTVSDLFIENFIDTSNEWMAARGLKNRTQPYGMKYDVIRGSGHAHIPETEQLYSEGTEMFLKMVSSGAQLYNRPLISSESIVFQNRDYMTSPQKIKIAVDKLFTSGVNQVIYHGTPYRYLKPVYGDEGWNPWSNAVVGATIAFSTVIAESDPYWKYQKEINEYITRSQYALRAGGPVSDVLIYYPFLGMNFHPQQHDELLFAGVLEDVEPPPISPALAVGAGDGEDAPPEYGEQTRWLIDAWKVIRELDRRGIAWSWVNDESLQGASWKDGRIGIRGNRFQAVLLLDAPHIRKETAEKLAELASSGAAVAVVGDPPSRQPGYLNYEENDKAVQRRFEEILSGSSGLRLNEASDLFQLEQKLERPVAYAGAYPFLKHVQRTLPGGGRLVFLRNTTDQDQSFGLEVSSELRRRYWLDPRGGRIYRAAGSEEGVVSHRLGPYGSIILYADSRALLGVGEPPLLDRFGEAEPVLDLDRWNLQAGGVSLSQTGLFDWRNHESLRYSSALGEYATTFELKEKAPGKRYVLDLGKVYFTADVEVNGCDAGGLIFAPYRLDVTEFLEEGQNELRVTVTPVQRNGFVGRGLAGDRAYERFTERPDSVVAAGMAGPVRLLALE